VANPARCGSMATPLGLGSTFHGGQHMDEAHEIVSGAFDDLCGFSSLQELEIQST
jgi:hypothetical protein